jgi:hypothetical protein
MNWNIKELSLEQAVVAGSVNAQRRSAVATVRQSLFIIKKRFKLADILLENGFWSVRLKSGRGLKFSGSGLSLYYTHKTQTIGR